jgi:TonB-dependent SusC/RagA subfamily outer membrane receptor
MEKYFLHINEPCSQNWDEMAPMNQGRFCTNCNKTVFDFTTASDNEIIKHIERIKGEEFCGKFEEHQLDRWIQTSSLKTSNKKLYEFLLSFLLLTGSPTLYAQEVSNKEKIALKKQSDSTIMRSAIKSEVSGIVCNSTKPLVFQDTRIIIGGARTISKKDNPIIILDGLKIKMSKLGKIDPSEIKSIDVLKSKEATSIYGPEGVNGVILITSKNPTKGKIDFKTSLKPNS